MKMQNKLSGKFQIFVDLDGVLADFDLGVKAITGKYPSEMTPGKMWKILASQKNFFSKLKWMPDGKKLWQAVLPYNPVVLTGLPLGKWAEPQKRTWCRNELGETVPVITGMSKDKPYLAIDWLEENRLDWKIPLLIDDRLKLKEPWENTGGIFILHLDADSTIKELKEKGII